MTDQTPPVDEMHYEQLAQDALRGVIRLALERAAEPEGIPGAHHFYITFKTRGAGVSVPPDVLAKYPDEMTVVLQHQYWDLAVEPDLFSVMLKFGGAPKVLTVPYSAVRSRPCRRPRATRTPPRLNPRTTTARRSFRSTNSARNNVFAPKGAQPLAADKRCRNLPFLT